MIKRLCASLREFESPQGARSRSCLICNTNNVLLRNYFLALKSKGPIWGWYCDFLRGSEAGNVSWRKKEIPGSLENKEKVVRIPSFNKIRCQMPISKKSRYRKPRAQILTLCIKWPYPWNIKLLIQNKAMGQVNGEVSEIPCLQRFSKTLANKKSLPSFEKYRSWASL